MTRFALRRATVPDAATRQEYEKLDVWHAMINRMNTLLRAMLYRAQTWHTAFRDERSMGDIHELLMLRVRLEGLVMGDRKGQLAQRFMQRMSSSFEHFYARDLQVYQDCAARLQAFADVHGYAVAAPLQCRRLQAAASAMRSTSHAPRVLTRWCTSSGALDPIQGRSQ